MKKYYLTLIFLLLLPVSSKAQTPQPDKAEGVFLAIGVGPRLPIGSFANSSDVGYGFNFEISYTNTDYLPLFLYSKAGYETYPLKVFISRLNIQISQLIHFLLVWD